MRFAAAALLLCSLRASAGVLFDESAVQDFGHLPGGGYHETRTDVSSPFGRKGVYSIWANADLFSLPNTFDGWSQEYSAGIARELYHVTVKGRLGTAPPDAKYSATVSGQKIPDKIVPSYHVAGGEADFSFYGFTMGPEHPELSQVVWESSGPAPAPESFDRTWATRARMIYTNTDIHIERPVSMLVVVQNSWQFDFRETWRDRASVAFQLGGDYYNRVITNGTTDIYLNNVDYYGGPGAITGWVNNYVSGDAWAAVTDKIRVDVGATRLNLMKNTLLFMYGANVQWRPDEHWRVTPGFVYNFRRDTGARRGARVDFAYGW